ncbi:DNA recombination protein RmuC [Patescibacteria group bacterium]
MTNILLILVLISVAVLMFLVLRKPKKDESPLIMQQLNHMNQVLDSKLSESTKTIQTQFNQSAKIISSVTEKLTRLDDTNRKVIGFADQLKNLQDILKNPKQRGILGEYYLETVLKNVLPPKSFQMQYTFKNGTIVDAAVFIDKRIIPIDSKFSLENYNRILECNNPDEKRKYESALVSDLKIRIDETAKYVRPEEKTMDFAFMFIPSEAVFYDLLINKVGAIAEDTNDLIYYAGKKKVIIVSPTSFLAYLQTVLQGLRNQKISEQAQEIIKEVERLGRHTVSYSEYFKRIGEHLSTTVSSYNKAGAELKKIDKDVVKIAETKPSIEIKKLDKPKVAQEEE